MTRRLVTQTMKEFEALARTLIQAEASDETKRATLAAFMDINGVPAMSLEVLKDDPVIVELFASRGVRLVGGDEA